MIDLTESATLTGEVPPRVGNLAMFLDPSSGPLQIWVWASKKCCAPDGLPLFRLGCNLVGFYSCSSRVLQGPRKYLPRVPEIMPEIVPDPALRSAQIILVLRNKEFFIVLGNPRPQADLRRGSGSPPLTYLS